MRYLITGTNRGIGLELTRQLVARGDSIIATCRQPRAANALQQLSKQYGERLTLLPLDVSDPASISASYQAVSNSGLLWRARWLTTRMFCFWMNPLALWMRKSGSSCVVASRRSREP